MLLPPVLVFIVNAYLPMVGLLIAFKDINYTDGIFTSPWVGFRNFEYLFTTTDAWRITRNTILYNLLFIFSGLVLSVGIAIALNEIKTRFFPKLYQTIMIMPNFLSMVIVAFVGYAFLSSDSGYINRSILEPLGIPGINWYTEPKYWPFILPFINIWKTVGMNSIIYLAAITSIHAEYYEAAVIDGAGKWKQIRHITLPLLTPVMVILTILAVGNIFRADFGLFYQTTMNSAALYPTTDVIDTYVYRALMNLGDIGMSSAASFYQSVVGFICIMGANWIVKKINSDNAMF
ncbi:sugar ABC transporter permease (plasmid) [Paenibacillus rhizovicinus]|uniref:Sugar ABC transporter permease n=2 Tax=Paenibacillus rhizovicinus TaxID=2704463 RepID=A0A6C0PAR7_9BACL|nr:sugar ABC transporter permease [Paenibacillus rhizovicinus]